MAEESRRGGRTEVSRIIHAPRKKVYEAFLDPQAVASWLAPENMRVHVHSFDPREGGTFRISLTYQNPEDAQRGKTNENRDTYHGRFVELVPYKRIIEVIAFESKDPKFAGEMKMTVRFADADGGTQVTLLYENVPVGIRPEDNEEGSRQSLKKLAALLE
ncbi:MAG TPA: SRPBCC family protein [Anaerolineae bacterium]|nr:SRPBCC family protein [Anaerolineae bacterium]